MTVTGAVCVRLPDVAVNVAVEDPAAAPCGAVSVSVAAVPGVRVTDVGCAVTPAGRPAMVTTTFAENPFCAVASRETVPGVPPAVKLTVPGMAVNEKFGCAVAACTVSAACALVVCPFTVAENITISVDAAAEEAAVMVNGSATPGVSDSVDGEMVTPAGSPETAMVAALVLDGTVRSKEAC